MLFFNKWLSPAHPSPLSQKPQLGANGLSTASEDQSSKEESVVHYLVTKRANINAVDIYGQTPLHFAAMRGNEIACRDLLSFRDSILIAVSHFLII